jgi:hypothetical protein
MKSSDKSISDLSGLTQSPSIADHALIAPGPWAADKVMPVVWAMKDDHIVCRIADVRGYGYLTGGAALNLSQEEAAVRQRATANFIAAAPDLFDALDGLLMALGLDSSLHPGDYQTQRQAGEAALAKARG